MYHHDHEFVRLVARERIEERVREADADRVARQTSGPAERRRRLRMPLKLFPRVSHRLYPRRLYT
jgi:hypothetical protein